MHGGRIHLYSACIYKDERRMPCTGKKNAPTFSFCVIKCVDFWFCHVNMKEKVRKRPCIPQEASQTAHFDPPGSLALHGRGGSVSRRDHNQAAGTRVQLAGGASLEEESSLFPAALRERGVWGERRFSQRSPSLATPPPSPPLSRSRQLCQPP